MNLQTLPDWLNRETAALAALFLAAVAFFAYLAWASRRDELIRFTDALTGDNGRIVSSKMIQFIGFALTSWGMVYLTATGKANATEWALFFGACGGLALGNKAVNNNANAKAQEISAANGTPPPIPPTRD